MCEDEAGVHEPRKEQRNDMDSNNKTERLGIKDLSHTNMADRLETANIHSNRATEIIHLQRCIHRY